MVTGCTISGNTTAIYVLSNQGAASVPGRVTVERSTLAYNGYGVYVYAAGGDNTALADTHTSTINVPAGVYNTVAAQFTFKITWTPVVNINTSDEILTVVGVGSSDGEEGDGSNDTRLARWARPTNGLGTTPPEEYIQ